jgi:hypothetical protein
VSACRICSLLKDTNHDFVVLTIKQAFFYTDCVVIALDPGRVETDMNPNGLISAPEAVALMIRVVDGLSKIDTATFVSWEGKTVGW